MEKPLFKKIAIIWATISFSVFIYGLYSILKNNITLGVLFLLIGTILVTTYRYFIIRYGSEWDFWHLECPKCNFVWEPETGSTNYISTSPYDFFHPGFWDKLLNKLIKLPWLIRCPNCHKLSWCKYIIERKEVSGPLFIDKKNKTLLYINLIIGLGIIIFSIPQILKINNYEKIFDKSENNIPIITNSHPINNNSYIATTSTSNQSETVDWQTYRNEKYGFEIKYPPEYKISTQTGTDVGPAIRADSYAVILFRDFTGYYTKEEIKNIKNNSEKIKIGPLEAFAGPLRGNMDEGIEYSIAIFDYPKEDAYLNILFSTTQPGRENEIDIFSQILSTFRFLE